MSSDGSLIFFNYFNFWLSSRSDNRLTGEVPKELCRMNLNEILFSGMELSTIGIIDEAGSTSTTYNQKANTSSPLNQRELQTLLRRNGCTSIACPAGSRSVGKTKDGVFPCEKCPQPFLNPYLGANQCAEISQEQILNLFYDATNGDNWAHGANTWTDVTIPTCSKDGITCDQQGSVKGISLAGNNLSGTLISHLGYLNSLTELNISNNKVQGTLPAELALAPLSTLDVSENRLTGTVPAQLCQKLGVNGNGKNGIFSCDVISCHMGSFALGGHADVSTRSDQYCKSCDNSVMVLGSKACYPASKSLSSSLSTEDGISWVRPTLITAFGLCILFAFICFRRRLFRGVRRNDQEAWHTSEDEENNGTRAGSAASFDTPEHEVPPTDISTHSIWYGSHNKEEVLDIPQII